MRQRLLFALLVALVLFAAVTLGLPLVAAPGSAPSAAGLPPTLGVAIGAVPQDSDDSSSEEELEEFVPSEEVSADQSVSFPVDI